jgi:hypothetical protein
MHQNCRFCQYQKQVPQLSRIHLDYSIQGKLPPVKVPELWEYLCSSRSSQDFREHILRKPWLPELEQRLTQRFTEIKTYLSAEFEKIQGWDGKVYAASHQPRFSVLDLTETPHSALYGCYLCGVGFEYPMVEMVFRKSHQPEFPRKMNGSVVLCQTCHPQPCRICNQAPSDDQELKFIFDGCIPCRRLKQEIEPPDRKQYRMLIKDGLVNLLGGQQL